MSLDDVRWLDLDALGPPGDGRAARAVAAAGGGRRVGLGGPDPLLQPDLPGLIRALGRAGAAVLLRADARALAAPGRAEALRGFGPVEGLLVPLIDGSGAQQRGLLRWRAAGGAWWAEGEGSALGSRARALGAAGLARAPVYVAADGPPGSAPVAPAAPQAAEGPPLPIFAEADRGLLPDGPLPGIPADTTALDRALAARRLCRPTDLLGAPRVHELCVMASFACQLRCDYCWLWGEPGLAWDAPAFRRRRPAVPLERLLSLIDELIPYELGLLNLSGGEPLRGDSWAALARHAKARGVPVAVTTGGPDLLDALDPVFELLDQVHISLNAHAGNAERVRPGPKGHYERTRAGLRAFAERRRREGRGPELRLLTTLTASNHDGLEALVRGLLDEGVDLDHVYIQLLIYNDAETRAAQAAIHAAEFGRGAELGATFSADPGAMDFDLAWAQIEAVRARHPRVALSAPVDRAGLERYYRGDKRGLMPNHCAAPWTAVGLLPDGDLFTCLDLPIGNVLQGSFRDIWEGHEARRLRARVRSTLFPACTGCFHYYSER
jgi:MoaA/NifB/PqqE/SkfB family radical SAM enzyme